MKLNLKWWGLPLQLLALNIASPALAEVVDINLLHLNEITSVEGGKRKTTRVATCISAYLCVNLRAPLRLKIISNSLQISEVAQQWLEADRIAPQQAIATTNIALDGLQSSVRNRATNLTALIAQAMLNEVYRADLAMFNAGSIRIDDYIPPGVITQSDIIQILPFGGKVLAVEMKGSLLEKVLEQGRANRGTGGFLHTANVSKKPDVGMWMINGEPLDPNQNYRVAIHEFLMSGKVIKLEFLNFKAGGVKLVGEKRDIRFAVIDQLRGSIFRSW